MKYTKMLNIKVTVNVLILRYAQQKIQENITYNKTSYFSVSSSLKWTEKCFLSDFKFLWYVERERSSWEDSTEQPETLSALLCLPLVDINYHLPAA